MTLRSPRAGQNEREEPKDRSKGARGAQGQAKMIPTREPRAKQNPKEQRKNAGVIWQPCKKAKTIGK